MEEAGDYVKVMRDAGLDTVFLAAPTSTERRLKLVAEYSSGFVYLVSRTGITGEQQNISDSALPLIERMRAHTESAARHGFRHFEARAGRRARRITSKRWSSAAPSCARSNAIHRSSKSFMRELTRPT